MTTSPCRSLWVARASAAVSLVGIAAFSLAADSVAMALRVGTMLGLPYALLLGVLSFPVGRLAERWGFSLARATGALGLAGLVLALPVLLESSVPVPPLLVMGLFPFAQATLLSVRTRARGEALAARARIRRALPWVASATYLVSVAILGPFLLPKRTLWSLNERRALMTVQYVASAQHAFKAHSGTEAYGAIECLVLGGVERQPAAEPARDLRKECSLTSSPPGSPAFATEPIPTIEDGYRFELHGVPVDGQQRLMQTFAFTAIPLRARAYPGWRRTGGRAFCADSSGRLCALADGTPPGIESGVCAPSCPNLR